MPVSVIDIKVISVGRIKDASLRGKIEDYIHRTTHDAKIEVVEIRDAGPEMESRKLQEILQKEQGYIVALTEEGRQFDSVHFAHHLEKISRRIIFVIGGPFGLSPEVKRLSHELLSLSKMTFPHEIARMLLMEQLYRAVSIIKNRAYHK